MVEVIQADRDAAADSLFSYERWGMLVRAGARDADPIVQAFARHRIAAAQAERAAVVEWLREEGTMQIDTGYDAGVYGGQGMHFAATAIEAGEHHA